MQFILTDVALGLTAFLGYRTVALLGRRPALAVRRNPAPAGSRRERGVSRPAIRSPKQNVPPKDRRDLMVLDPRRLARLG